MDFKQQHAIITGGSSGIGKATAQLLASQGANISIIARSQTKLALAESEIKQACLLPNQRVLALSADVADRSQVEQAIKAAIEQIGAPTLLITCAGVARPGYFQQLPVELFTSTMAVNYFGSLYCIKAVLPIMEQQRRGQIVLMSSGAGLIGVYGYTAYSSSKFAVRGLAESLRGELKPLGINISIVYPPDTDTPQLEEENKTKPAQTKAIAGTAKTWSAQRVADEIVRGIKNKTFAIAPGTEMTILARLHSLIAPGLNQYFDRIVAKVSSQNSQSNSS